MPIITVGQISNAHQAETILRTGQADMIALARPVMFNPHWAWQAAYELGESIPYPRQYERGNPVRWGAAGINAPGNVVPDK
jgi:2,4-dienoyl-CoA reductase-like NADH-dependent reductase (Old Yellow Enzyme family)